MAAIFRIGLLNVESKRKYSLFIEGLAPINTYSMLQLINHILDSPKKIGLMFFPMYIEKIITLRKSCLCFFFRRILLWIVLTKSVYDLFLLQIKLLNLPVGIGKKAHGKTVSTDSTSNRLETLGMLKDLKTTAILMNYELNGSRSKFTKFGNWNWKSQETDRIRKLTELGN